MVVHLKPLKIKHKEFLRAEGLNPHEWLYVSNTSESYTFYNTKVKKMWNFRR